jgi:serralysin
VHEILHGIGIKHPGNYNAGEPPQTVPGNFLAAAEDTEANSIMSYIKVPQGQQRDFLGPYDLLALQYLYGTKAVNTGDNTYSLGDSAGQRLQLINDNGGVNTLDASAATAPARIDLNQGKSSSIGRLADGTPATANVQIAFGTVVQNAVGTAGNDTIVGNSANNNINGGAGVDTVVFSGPRSAYTVTSGSTGWTVADTAAGRDGTDTLTNVERVRFSDTTVALDINGNAGTAAKVLGTVLGASAVSNKQFVGIVVGLLDGGMSYPDLMKLAMNTVLGAGYSSDAEVRLLYQNLVGTVPSNSDLANFSGLITSGQLTQTSLAVLAADNSINTNNIRLVGLATTGLEYTPTA